METYGSRLDAALKEKARSKQMPEDAARVWLAGQIGISVQALSQLILNKSKFLSVPNHEAAVKALGCSGKWLALGVGQMYSQDATAAIALEEVRGVYKVPSRLSPPNAEPITWEVPLLENAASMGKGSDTLEQDAFSGFLSLSPRWITDSLRPSNPQALRFIHGYGDSMSPTFNSGDVLLVDTEMKTVDTDGVFVLLAHDRLFIKRVRQRLTGEFEISSDNPAHKTVDVLNGDQPITILGRVVWVWNGRKIR